MAISENTVMSRPGEVIKQINQASSTTFIDGGVISINGGDNTKFDHTELIGVVVDNSNPQDIKRYPIVIPAKTAVTVEHLATAPTSFMGYDKDGLLVQQLAFPTGEELRTLLQFGSVVHGNNVNLSSVSNFTSASALNMAASLTDLTQVLGALNRDGNVFSGDPAGNLQFSVSEGLAFYLGINTKNNPLDPNNKTTGVKTGQPINFTWQDGIGGFKSSFIAAITGAVYDNNSGGGASAPDGVVTTNRWVNCLLQKSPDAEQEVIQYGQTTYNSDTSAVAAVALDARTMNRNPAFAGVPVRGMLSIRGAALDLTLAGDAVFTPADKFGDF